MRPPHAVGPFATLCLTCALTLVAACGKEGGPGTPLDPADPPPPPPPVNPDSTTTTVPASGGAVTLPDGSGVVFPAGALPSAMPVTVRKVDPARWFEADGAGGRVVLTTTTSVSQFNQPVEIRVPLPAGATPADSLNVLVGVIDEETGAVTIEPSSIKTIDGKPFLVVSTDHFTSRLFEWFVGKQPPSSAMLAVPYYNQGESNYCWATSLHMVTQAADFGQVRLITDIIGQAGIDEEGITSVEFRYGSAIAAAVEARTGLKPTRKVWNYGNARLVRDELWREIGVNGRPVAVYVGHWEHAVVVVGYDMNTFYLHDPASTSAGSVGYKARPWKDFVDAMGIKDRIVTLVVPRTVSGGDRLSVNFLNHALRFAKPGYGAAEPAAVYRLAWDHTLANGYTYRHLVAGDRADPLPGEVDRLQTPGPIEIVNASRTTPRDVTVHVEITAMDAPSGVGRITLYKDFTVGANATYELKLPDIPVDTFRYNRAEPVEYLFTVTPFTGGGHVDRQTVSFTIAPVRPDLSVVTPSTAAVGDRVKVKGIKLGRMPLNNTVTFNGTAVDSVVSWSDAEIEVLVPEGATTGPLVVKRGEVTSDSLDFTVAKSTTLSGTASRSFDLGGASLSATGTWTIQGVGASLDYHVPATQHHIFSVSGGETATFSYDFGAVVSPASWTTSQGNTVQFKYTEWTVETQLQPVTGSSPVLDQSGSGGSRSYTFTPQKRGDTFRSIVTVQVYGDLIGKDGKVIAANTRLTEQTVAIFVVEGS